MSETKENILTEFFNKNLPETVKEKFKTLMASFKAEEVKASDVATPAEPASYNERQLENGTVLKYTGDLAVGAKCLVVTPDGEVPAPEGEHKLMDGSTVVIKKEGEDSVITEIKPAEEMKDQAILAMIEKAVSAKFESIEKSNKELKAELEATKLKLATKSSQLKDLGTVVEAMASISTEEPIKKEVQTKPTRLSTVVKPRF